jgi:hypothetical protein
LPSISKAIGSTPSNGKKTTINKMTQTKKKWSKWIKLLINLTRIGLPLSFYWFLPCVNFPTSNQTINTEVSF